MYRARLLACTTSCAQGAPAYSGIDPLPEFAHTHVRVAGPVGWKEMPASAGACGMGQFSAPFTRALPCHVDVLRIERCEHMTSGADQVGIPDRAALPSLNQAHSHAPHPSANVQAEFSHCFLVQEHRAAIEIQFLTARGSLTADRKLRRYEVHVIEPQRQDPPDLLTTRASEEMQDGAEAAAGIDSVGDAESRSIHRVLLGSDRHGRARKGQVRRGQLV